MDFVCTQCGRRQAAGSACTACGDDNLLDVRKEQTRELLMDIDLRLWDRREAQIRMVSVTIGIVVVVALWLVPGYWDLRGVAYPGLPLFADQWIVMILIALGLSKLLERKFGAKPRFPFIDRSGNLI